MKLRKLGALFLSLALTLSLCAVPAAAAKSDFEIKDGVLTKYTGSGGAVVIPDSVTEIGMTAFSGCTGLTGVTIPGSVTEIGMMAFYDCTGLTSVTISDGVTEIGGGAFEYCSGLTSVTIPGSVTKISGFAFSGCTGLTSVTVPKSVTEISGSAFEVTPWLKSLGEFAIVNHILLAYHGAGGAVTIPDGITKIGGFAFSGCIGLTSVIIPAGVTEIGDFAFKDCTGLTSVTIPGSVTEIGDKAFFDCINLTSVTIPNSVTEIAYGAFSDGPDLTLYGGAGSAAEAYAKRESIPFVVGKAPAVPTAYAAPQTVLVDGKEVQFTAYALKDAAGNMTNYFKVRDVASVLNGTAAQFAVTWDGAVNLKSKTAYTLNGSEMTTPYTGDQPYGADKSAVKVNGAPAKIGGIVLTDAKGNGYTYYKLRDLGEHLGFQVDWNGKNVTISTAKPGGN